MMITFSATMLGFIRNRTLMDDERASRIPMMLPAVAGAKIHSMLRTFQVLIRANDANASHMSTALHANVAEPRRPREWL